MSRGTPSFATALVAFACASGTSAAAEPVRADRLVLDTKAHRLTLYRGRRVLRRYTVGLASKGLGKRRRGDRQTPVGRYRLFAGRASRRFLRFLPVSYPNAEDARRGLERGLITRAQHDAIVRATSKGRMPPQNTKLGGAIGIHGLGQTFSWLPGFLQPLHRVYDGTAGCILLTDDEVRDLERRYEAGAVLVIR